MLGQSIWAFDDSQSDPNADKIMALKEAGILLGGPDGTFKPNEKLTYAAGISMIVKGLNVSLAKYQFIKAPLASDYYTNVADDAWYADALITAHINGIELSQHLKPQQAMTREQFAHSLAQAIELNGPFAYIELFVVIEDEKDITPDYSGSIQRLLLTNIASLDEENKFYPQAEITRSEAAGLLYDAIQFIESTPAIPDEPQLEPNPFYDMTLESTIVNEHINEITVVAQAPHPGYGIRIASIVFEEDKAIIYTEASLPDPDMMYPQVITEVKAVTYVSSEYKPVLPFSSGDRKSVV